MTAPSLLRQLGIRYIEAALEKAALNEKISSYCSGCFIGQQPHDGTGLATDPNYYEALKGLYDKHMAPYGKTAADIRPGDAKPPAEVDRQASSLATVVNQLRKPELKTPIEEENAPRVLTPQK